MKTANDATTNQNGHANGHASLQNGHHDQRLGAANLLLQPRGMRKIRCPHCAVINLEKFVTFPHCAGCGALLNKETPSRPQWTAWRRPLGPILWATVLCCAAVAAVGAAMMLRRPAAMGQMAVYAQTMRTVPLNGTMQLSLTVDTIEDTTRGNSMLRDVRVRLDREFLKKFTVVKVTPVPLSEMKSGRGHYFVFGQIPRETPINFQFKTLRAGRHELKASVSADSLVPFDYLAFITVVADKATQKPKP